MSNVANSSFESLPVEEIVLDRSNPRIARWLEMYEGEITAEQMSLALGAGDSQTGEDSTTFHSLRESIRANGGVIHPIIVDRHADGKLVAIEGNTRVLIYREFREEGIRGEWSKIPSMVHNQLSEAHIDQIRLQAHLVGPRAWDPYSKAKYLVHLRDSAHLTMAQIVEFCGGRQKEVGNLIDAYHDMESYYRPILESDDQFDATRFSAFVELQNPRVKQSLLKGNYSLTDFAGWVKDHKLYPLQTVRLLPRILSNEKAKEVFLRDGAREALKVLDTPMQDTVLAKASLQDLAKEIAYRIRTLHYEELRRLRVEIGDEENDTLCEARDSLVQICSDIASSE